MRPSRRQMALIACFGAANASAARSGSGRERSGSSSRSPASRWLWWPSDPRTSPPTRRPALGRRRRHHWSRCSNWAGASTWSMWQAARWRGCRGASSPSVAPIGTTCPPMARGCCSRVSILTERLRSSWRTSTGLACGNSPTIPMGRTSEAGPQMEGSSCTSAHGATVRPT